MSTDGLIAPRRLPDPVDAGIRFQAVVSPLVLMRPMTVAGAVSHRHAVKQAVSLMREAVEILGGPVVLDAVVNHPTHPVLVWRRR